MKGGEIEFPEFIIQRLQTLLTGKEAARTTILSKSWHHAWLTRPNLDLDDSRFDRRPHYRRGGGEFSKYAKKTIKRYEQSNLKIESLKLCMRMNCYASAELANKLIVKALRNLGATHINLQLDNEFVLPREAVFGSDNLVGLSVKGCKIKLPGTFLIRCSRLESLGLDDVCITKHALCYIISSCPLIENLSLSNIRMKEEGWNDDDDDDDGPQRKKYRPSPSPDPLISDDSDDDSKKDGFGPRKKYRPSPAPGLIIDNFNRLRCLVLCYESYKTLFPGELLSKFPFLTDFTLKLKHWCPEEEVQISNCSLEHMKIEMEKDDKNSNYGYSQRTRLKVKLDVPSVRKFGFEGGEIPLVSIISTCTREWESHVSIEHCDGLTPFWFNELNEFLLGLSPSKIHLSLLVDFHESFDYNFRNVNIVRKFHDLENLTIDMTNLPSLSCHALFDGLFRFCHPKLITPCKDEDPSKEEVVRRHAYRRRTTNVDDYRRRTKNVDSLCRALSQGMLAKVSSPNQFMYGLNDLEEVNAQILDFPEWRSVPLESLFDAPLQQDEHQRVRLWLKWKPS